MWEVEMTPYADALAQLLGLDAGTEAQVLYVHLNSGRVLVFLGAPVSETDMDEVKEVHFGELIDPIVFAFAADRAESSTLPQ